MYSRARAGITICKRGRCVLPYRIDFPKPKMDMCRAKNKTKGVIAGIGKSLNPPASASLMLCLYINI